MLKKDQINLNKILNRYDWVRNKIEIKTFIFPFAVCLVKQTGDNGFRCEMINFDKVFAKI
jgi:hypothetical protein